MAIELIPKKEEIGLSRKLLFLVSSLIFLGVSILSVYFFFSVNKKENIKKELQTKYSVGFTPEQKKLEEKIILKKLQLDQLEAALKEHKFPSKVLDFLQKNTLENIQLTSVSFSNKKKGNSASNKKQGNSGFLEIEGTSLNFKDITLQIKQFRQQDEVKEVTLESLGRNKKGKIEFTLGILFEDNFLNLSP